jgi:hypothetical protein
MPPMRAAPRLVWASSCLLSLAALLPGCGDGSDPTATTTTPGPSAVSRPAPPQSAFPAPQGMSLRQVLKLGEAPAEALVAPAAMVFYRGVNRYPFGVLERDRTPVSDAEVALYIAKAPTPKRNARSRSGSKGAVAKAEAQALDEPAVGPFPAAIETLATKPAFRAETTAEDPDAASVVYSAQLQFPSDGDWRIAALIKEDGELKGKLLPSAQVGEFESIPRRGQPAPRIHTPTAADAGGDLARITTRNPPDTQNEVDYADALGQEPIVLLFATPQFCQSRVCGPVVDVAEQVKHEYGDEAAFIHMEIFNDNDPGKSVRPQVRAFNLPSEPWLFVIDRRGRVSSAIEGALGVEGMTAAVKKAVAG